MVVNYRSDLEGAESVAAEIERDGGRAVVLQADVSDPDAVKALFAAAEDAFGPVLVPGQQRRHALATASPRSSRTSSGGA